MVDASRAPRTLFDRIWDRHVVFRRDDGAELLHVDCHLIQDGSAPAFEMLRGRGLTVRRPDQSFATPDHYVPTDSRSLDAVADPEKRAMANALEQDCSAAGIRFFGLNDSRQGIVHVVGPEQGLSLPGSLIVCGDSHTSTHGAMGALAFGIGASEVAHVLATQTIWMRRPKTMAVTVHGRLGPWVTAKDVILAIIGQLGAAGATGHVIEYRGAVIRALSMEARMTLCNMSIEAGARAGMVAPDETTFRWLAGRPFAPSGAAFDAAVADWSQLAGEGDAGFDRVVELDGAAIQPMVTWGTSPEDVQPVSGRVPDPNDEADPDRRAAREAAIRYMGLEPGQRLSDLTVDRVFIGSCTNGRLEDLQRAAAVVRGRRVHPSVEAWVVPGSGLVRQAAEAQGLDIIFRDAGFQWRHAGCSMCLGTNGDQVPPGKRCASTSNRNFVGRQGPGARTHLMSPAMAAAAALAGHIVDVRTLSPVDDGSETFARAVR